MHIPIDLRKFECNSRNDSRVWGGGNIVFEGEQLQGLPKQTTKIQFNNYLRITGWQSSFERGRERERERGGGSNLNLCKSEFNLRNFLFNFVVWF